MPHRVNVYFTDQAFRTLEDVAAVRGCSMSDAMRYALGLARWWAETRAQGSRHLVESSGGQIREVVSFDA